MALTSFKLLTDTRDAEHTLTKSGYERSYKYAFIAETDDKNDGPVTLINALPFSLGDFYAAYGPDYTITDGDFGAQLNSIRLRHVNGNPKLWRVEIGFDSVQGDSNEEQQKEDPTDREPKTGVRFQKMQLPVTADVTGTVAPFSPASTNIATNTLGQRFNPPPTYERTVPVIWAYSDVTGYSFGELCQTQDLINSVAFLGCPARTLLINLTDVSERHENSQRVWRKSYEMRYNPLTWDALVMNEGTVEDKKGNNVQRLLSSDSTVLESSQTSLVVYLTLRPYRAVPFATSTDIPIVIRQLPSLNTQ